jgi:hypothetical protein
VVRGSGLGEALRGSSTPRAGRGFGDAQ